MKTLLTKKKVRIEIDRVADVLETKHFTRIDYDATCKEGYTVYLIKKELGLTFNKIKKKFGFPILRSGYQQGVTKLKPARSTVPKVFCKRGKGAMISWKNECYPGNDDCLACPHPNEKNRMSYTLTKEDEDEFKFTSNTQGGYGITRTLK